MIVCMTHCIALTAALTCALALVAPVQSQAQTSDHRPDWLCLGTSPGFMMTIQGDKASFDYLGDGVYAVDPAVPAEPPTAASRHDLVTSRTRIGMFLERRECRVIGADLPVRIELAIPTSVGLRPMVGCCKQNGR